MAGSELASKLNSLELENKSLKKGKSKGHVEKL
jgi:hypothetical protein